MCGICGIVDKSGVVISPDLLGRLNHGLLHRGPDEGGEWIDGSAGLAMRRLAIIDLIGGQQPMFNEDGSKAIVFNGEIYNYLDLRDELIKSGHQIKTKSDTETIIHLVEQYGPSGLAKLNGMFAVAIWDRNEQSLLLARDRAGKKPLYYAMVDGRIVFSSEMASLLEHPGISREIDPVALDNYFSLGYVPAPHTIFKQVRQLEPGHFLSWSAGKIKIERYWRLAPSNQHFRSEDEAADALLVLLKDAVRIRLHSDVPFGALLSGGVDSGLVVALMSQMMNQPVQTFTVGFSDKNLDESTFAAEVAKRFGTEHHTLIAQAHSAVDMVRTLSRHFGEPFADASAIPTFLVSEMARKHVTMALSGDGGDEVFGGYKSYQYHAKAAAYRSIPGALRGAVRLGAGLLNGHGGSTVKRAKRFLEESELPVEDAWLHSRSIFADADLNALYTDSFKASITSGSRGQQIRQAFNHFGPGSAEALNLVDYETYLPGDILVKVDRMSMANSLEMRAPLLDYRIAEFAAALPTHWKWTAFEGKKILKRAAGKILPPSVLSRPKQGFVAPIGPWLQGELQPFVREVIASSGAGSIVRLDYCLDLLERHVRGEGFGIERKLWSVLCFLIWHQEFAS